jgi:hypothetical protein
MADTRTYETVATLAPSDVASFMAVDLRKHIDSKKKECLRAMALEILELCWWTLLRWQCIYINIISCGKFVEQHFVQTWRLDVTPMLHEFNASVLNY